MYHVANLLSEEHLLAFTAYWFQESEISIPIFYGQGSKSRQILRLFLPQRNLSFTARVVGGEVLHLVRDPGHAALGRHRDGQDRVPKARNREAGAHFDDILK